MLDTNVVSLPTPSSSVAGINSANNEKAEGVAGKVVYEASREQEAKRFGHVVLDAPVRPADPAVARDLENAVKIDNKVASILKTPTDKEVATGAVGILADGFGEVSKKFPGNTPDNIGSIIKSGSGKLNFTQVLLQMFSAFQDLQRSTREDRLDEFKVAIQSIIAQAKTMRDGAITQLLLGVVGAAASVIGSGVGLAKLGKSFSFMKNSPIGSSTSPLVQQALGANIQSATMRHAGLSSAGQATSSFGQAGQGFFEEQKAEEQADQQRANANSEHSNDIRKAISQAILEFVQNFKSNSESEIQTQKSILNRMV